MIVGIGVDVLDVTRMERELRRDPDGFRAELFTPREIADCELLAFPPRHYAARFAAKEALLKALDAASRDGGSWREVEVCPGPHGAPGLRLHGRMRGLAEHHHVQRILVSLAHVGGLAAATVVLDDGAPGTAPGPGGPS